MYVANCLCVCVCVRLSGRDRHRRVQMSEKESKASAPPFGDVKTVTGNLLTATQGIVCVPTSCNAAKFDPEKTWAGAAFRAFPWSSPAPIGVTLAGGVATPGVIAAATPPNSGIAMAPHDTTWIHSPGHIHYASPPPTLEFDLSAPQGPTLTRPLPCVVVMGVCLFPNFPIPGTPDTPDARLAAFSECLRRLESLMGVSDVGAAAAEGIFFPHGVCCGGIGCDWVAVSAAIDDFAARVPHVPVFVVKQGTENINDTVKPVIQGE